MRLFIYLIGIALIIGVASADVSIVDDTLFNLGNGAFIKVLAVQNSTNITVYSSTNSPASTLQFYINGTAIRFTANTNKTLSNISYDNATDVVTYTGNGTDGYLNVSTRMQVSSVNYGLKVDGVVDQRQQSNATGWVTFNYTGWSPNLHVFEISNRTYIPPAPTNLINVSDNFYVNHSWQAGSGNITDSYNVSVNGTWHNGANSTYYNNSGLAPHGWSNISVYSYNSSGTGTMNTTAVSQNTRVPDNPVTITNISDSYNLNDSETLYIAANCTDIDGDTCIFNRNFTQGTFDSSTGILNWQAGYGNYSWQINVTDGFGSVSRKNFTVAVNDIHPPSQVTNFHNSTIPTADSVNVAWNASNDGANGSGIKEYRIERTNESFNYMTIDRPIINATGIASGYENDSYWYTFKTNEPVNCQGCHVNGRTRIGNFWTKYNTTYLYVMVHAPDNDTNISDDNISLAFDVNRDSGTAPQPDDQMYEITEQNNLLRYTGNGTDWVANSTSAVSAVAGAGSKAPVYEIRIPLSEIGSPSNNTPINFLFENVCTGSGDFIERHTYFPKNPNASEKDPSSWGLITFRSLTDYVQIANPSGTSYMIADLKDGFRYDFTAKAVDNVGNTGQRSDPLIIQTAGDLGYNISGYVFNYLGNPIPNVRVQTPKDYIVSSHSNGDYFLEELINFTYDVTASSGVYSSDITQVTVNGADVHNVNITIPHITVNATDLVTACGNFYCNSTWTAGGNTTSFNISQNETWYNGTTNNYFNVSISPHEYSNITVSGYNDYTTALSIGSVTQNTSIQNNPVTIGNISDNYSLIEGQTLIIYPNSTDADSDTPTFARNFTNGTFYTNNGTMLWTTTGSDIGIHSWQINVTDGYGSVSSANFTVTVNSFEVSLTNISALTNTTFAGTNAIYILNLTNNGTAGADTYNLTIDNTNGASASLNVSPDFVYVPQAGSVIFALNVTNASSGIFRVNVTATSVNNSNKIAYINTTTTVNAVRAVSLSVDPTARTTSAGTNATYVLNITNNGSDPDTYTLLVTNASSASVALLNISSPTSTLGSGQSLILALNVTNTSSGTFLVNVTATSSSDATKFAYVNTTTTVNAVRAVNLTVNPSEQATSTGTNATYLLNLTNNGTDADTYTLVVTNANNASTALLNTSLSQSLNAGQSLILALNVTNSSAGSGTFNVNVSATSSDPTKFAFVNTTTTVNAVRAANLTVNPGEQATSTGTNATYILNLTNNGTDADTYTLLVTNSSSASVALLNISSPTSMLSPGQSLIFALNVTNTSSGTFKVNVTATSSSDATKFAYVNTTTTVNAVRAVSLSIDAPSKDTDAGVNATYVLNLTNNGSDPDSYALLVTNASNASVAALNISSPTSTLSPGQSLIFALNVTNTSSGTFKVNVTAISQGNNSKFASVNTTTVMGAIRGVSLSIDAPSKSTDAGVNATYVLNLTNNGTDADTYTLLVTNSSSASVALLNISSPTSTLGSGQSLIFAPNVTNTSSGNFSVNVTATSSINATKFAYVNTTTAVNAVRAVSLTINTTAQTTSAGTNATYILNLTNNGTDADTYTLIVTNANSASTALLNTSLSQSLNAGQSVIFALNVTNTSSGTFLVNVTATSGNDATKFAYVNTTTIVNAVPTYIPPTPTDLSSTQGNFWINYTWSAGSGSVTDSYNVSVNGTWHNGTNSTYYNNSGLAPHGWSNISVYSFNNSGTGTLNSTAVSQNTRVPNNVPVQASIGNKNVYENETLSFTVSATDADGDTMTFGTNASKGSLNTTTGLFTWTPTFGDSGIYVWYFNSSDGYEGIATETITVTVNNIPLTITSRSPGTDPTTIVDTGQTFTVNLNRSANVTWYINGISVQGNTSITSASYTNLTSGVGVHNLTAMVSDAFDTTPTMWNWTVTAFPTHMPPTPSNLTSSTGYYFVNHSWQAGDGNVTDSYNVSVNGTWQNDTTGTYYNNSGLSAHGWSNISVYSFNTSGTGALNETPVTANTQVPNNVPVLTPIVDKVVTAGIWLNFTVVATDADGDPLTYGTNATRGALDPASGNFNWSTTGSDVGTYVWYFSSSDTYGGVASGTITVTVTAAPTYLPPSPVNLASTTGNFYVNHTWNAGSGNVTHSYKVSVNGTFQNIGLNWSAGIPVGVGILALTYAGNGTVIAGDYSNGNIYRSTDYGQTWGAGISVGSSIGGLTYTGNGVIIAADSNNGNIYRSTDYGQTWSAGIPVGSAIFELTYAENGTVIAADSNNGNIYRSTDYGQTWSAGIPVGSVYYASTYAGNGTVIAGDYANGNIYRSTDYGQTWSAGIPVGSSIGVITYAGNGIVFAADSNNGNIYRSTDYGQTWSAGIPVGSVIFALTYAGNGIVIAGEDSDGDIYRSTDYGQTWSADILVGSGIDGIIYIGNGIVIAGDYKNGNIYRSDPTYTTHTYYNNSGLSAHGWSNISVYSFNNSGTGTLNETPVTANTQVPNNPVSIGNVSSSYTLTAGDMLSIYPTSSDLDGDTPTFASNFTNGTFYANNGTLFWTTTGSDEGIHSWQINVTDGYGSVSFANFTVTVTAVLAPNITSWGNNKTNNESLTLTLNNSEGIRFNATANQSITTWTWFQDDVNQNNNYDNFSTSLTGGNHTIKVNATNGNGVSNTITWIVTITPTPTISPVITGFAPSSPVIDIVGATRTFNITVNQTVNVTWYVNGTQAQTNTSVTNAGYTNASAGLGVWNVTATAANSNGVVSQVWIWNVTAAPSGAPNITSFAPSSPVNDIVGVTRIFNITVNQTVNVTWYINGTQAQTNISVTDASYTNTSAVLGVWNISANAANSNGVVSQAWIWNVTAAPTGTPNITSFAPASPVNDIVGATRTFNIIVNQIVNITWYINGTQVQTSMSVTGASYTNTSAVLGVWNITATATNSNGVVSQVWMWNVAAAPTPAPTRKSVTGGGGGGGGGEGAKSSEPPINIESFELAEQYLGANTPASYIFTTPNLVISEVLITPARNFGTTSIRIETLKNLSNREGMTPPPGIVYKYVNIWVGAGDIDSPDSIIDAFIGFEVDRGWLAQNNLEENNIRLLRWDGSKWNSLDTQPTSSDETFAYYYSRTNAFSPFAIVALPLYPSATAQAGETPITEAPMQELIKQLAVERVSWLWMYALIALILISLALYKLSKYQKKAIKVYEAVAIKPENADAWYGKGAELQEIGKYEEAIKSYDKAIEINPEYSNAWNNKGFALYELGKYEEAAKAYDKAREIIHRSRQSDEDSL